MDFDFGNLIYIIATLVAILVGVLGKKKKPTGGVPLNRPGQEGKNNLFDVLSKEFEGYMETGRSDQSQDYIGEPEPELSEVVGEAGPVTEPVTNIYSAYNEGIYNPESETNLSLMDQEGMNATGAIQVINLDEDPGVDYFEVVKDFDLEAAIIYSAVISRIDY